MDLPGHDGKVTPDMKMICKSYQRYKGENIDYCSHSSVIFETAKKFLFIYFYFSLLFCQN